MTLVLDGGKPSYADITSYVTADTSGRAINVEYPLKDLPDGMHSLTFTVYDLVGNYTSRTINFVVGTASSATMTADKLPATVGSQVNFDMATDMETSPEFTVRVTDAVGHLVWTTKTSTFPVAWDMKDKNGNSVPAGLYRYYGTYSDGVNYGGTPIGDLIVIDPLKVATR
jgi:flagellar hook assembly protein FlgD